MTHLSFVRSNAPTKRSNGPPTEYMTSPHAVFNKNQTHFIVIVRQVNDLYELKGPLDMMTVAFVLIIYTIIPILLRHCLREKSHQAYVLSDLKHIQQCVIKI